MSSTEPTTYLNNPPPTLGRVVLYTLTDGDAAAINKRRNDFSAFAARIAKAKLDGDPAPEDFDLGYQAHVGNRCLGGQEFPADVVGVNGGGTLNLQVKLDGNDTYWATSVDQRNERMPHAGQEVVTAGRWRWPPRV